MTYLLDTNVISEVRKKERCDRHVRRWCDDVTGSGALLLNPFAAEPEGDGG